MSSGWTKLFGSIVTSSVWCEDDSTLRVWVAMLATSNADGVVQGSVPGFANLARVSIEQMESALATLTAPDPYSRTPDHAGRRVEPVDGGWRILNYAPYRARGQAKEGSRAPYMRDRRARERGEAVTRNTQDVTRYTEERGEKRDTYNDPPNPPAAQVGTSKHGSTLNAACERVRAALVASGGKATRKVRKQIYEALKSGEAEEQLLADVQADAEIRAAETAEKALSEERIVTARVWIEAHGGGQLVARAAVEWAQRNLLTDETISAALARWASDGVPPGVRVLLRAELEAAQKAVGKP